MFQILNYQKKDSLGKIMYKLEEAKEKLKFQKKERITFTIFILMGLAVAGTKVFFKYTFTYDKPKFELS